MARSSFIFRRLYSGSSAIALPKVPSIYMRGQNKGVVFDELSSHPFVVAHCFYQLMINEGVSKSIFVSGKMGSRGLSGEIPLRWGLILILEVGNGAHWLNGKLGNINELVCHIVILESITNYGKFRQLVSQ